MPRILEIDAPTRTDPFLARATRGRIGSSGRRSAGAKFFTPMRVLILLTTLAAIIAAVFKTPCRLNGWGLPGAYFGGCYSDWSALYGARGLAENPWAALGGTSSAQSGFEYPVIIAAVAGVLAWLAPLLSENAVRMFYDLNFLAVVVLWIATVVVTAKTAGRKIWDVSMLAVAPAIIFAGFVNWDMWAVAAMMLAIWLLAGRKYELAGVVIGLGTATKVFPLFLLGAILVLALRSRTYRPMVLTTLGVVFGWLVVNLPLMFGNFEAWKLFYTFSSDRAPGWSSIWQVWNQLTPDSATIDGALLGPLSTICFAAGCAVVLVLGLKAPRTPSVPELMFLILAFFILFNKVYSPQFAIWLVPLFALVLGNWRDFIIWQVIEVLHFWAVWSHLAAVGGYYESQHLADPNVYVLAVFAHVAVLIYLMVRVARQMWRTDAHEGKHSADVTKSVAGAGASGRHAKVPD